MGQIILLYKPNVGTGFQVFLR